MYLKKNISTVERNASLLENALGGYAKHQIRTLKLNVELQAKGSKIGTVLDIIAEQEADEAKLPLMRLSKLLHQKEAQRLELAQRIESSCVDPFTGYPALCDKLLVCDN